jgi:putative hemolysin
MELLVIFILLLFNGIFAMFEIALVSARKSRLLEEAKFGNMGARTALNLLKEPEKILSAIQVGITLIGIVAGAYGGVALAEDVAPWFIRFPALAPYAHTLAVIIVVGFITYLSLIIGELVPKTIALNNPEKIAMFLSPVMRILGAATYPVVWFLSISTKIVLKVAGIKSRKESPVTEEELRILLKQGSEQGVIEKEESQIISEVIRFGDKRAGMVMTHRFDVEWIDISKTMEEIVSMALKSTFSRMPACYKTVEDVKGVLEIKDLLVKYIINKNLVIEDLITEPLFIPEQLSAPRVLELFRTSKNHFGIVYNEYGTMEGIITLHDIIENIMGDMPAIEDKIDTEFFRREDGSYLVDGSMRIDDLKDLLGVRSLIEDEDADEESGINTLAGLVIHKLEHIPKVGDTFTAKGYRFEIVDMDGNRVDKILITLLN